MERRGHVPACYVWLPEGKPEHIMPFSGGFCAWCTCVSKVGRGGSEIYWNLRTSFFSGFWRKVWIKKCCTVSNMRKTAAWGAGRQYNWYTSKKLKNCSSGRVLYEWLWVVIAQFGHNLSIIYIYSSICLCQTFSWLDLIASRHSVLVWMDPMC